ncbi:sulfatase [Tenacibaculum sp. UWU-22]|uniref:sulfatase family protein n=1 Tax=Tenacibaculum sp. UWU-22 TaxID=3234187 RepID=UPI0034DB6B4F
MIRISKRSKGVLAVTKMLFVLTLATACNTNNIKKDTSSNNLDTITKPNILWIVADDVGTDLHCYGNKLIHTPNLDSLASTGIKYTNMYTTASVCSVSRTTLITGTYPVSINAHQHRTRFKDSLPKNVKTLPELFKKAGYFVSNFGKTDYNFIHDKNTLYDGEHWKERKGSQPFFAQVQIKLPHRPFLKDSEHPINPDLVTPPPYYPNQAITRKDWAMYLETIQIMDKQVGDVLKELKKDGLDKNTIVFFFGDQGRPMLRAKQYLYDAGLHTPMIISFPDRLKSGTINNNLLSNIDIAKTTLMLAGITPPSNMKGINFLKEKRKYIYATRDRMDETVDRMRMIRSDRFKYIKNYYPERPYTQFNAYKKFNYPVLTLMTIMNKKGLLNGVQAQFMAQSKPSEELYDLVNDPFEINNLASNTKYTEIKQELKTKLLEWVKENDFGKYPESEKEIEYAKKMMANEYKKWMEKVGLNPSISDADFLNYWEKKLQIKPTTF